MVIFGRIKSSSIQLEKLATTESPFDIFQKLYGIYDRVYILESLVGPKELAEMTIIGFDPKLVVKCDFNKFIVQNRFGKILHSSQVREPLAQLRELVPEVKDHRFRFIGGAVGYISYDAVQLWEAIAMNNRKKSSKFPLLEFGIYDDGILFNQKENQGYYFFLEKSRKKEVEHKMLQAKKNSKLFSY
ncbi:MAG TPA: anthranilate synthase component I, partial [Nitrososphaera sp.]